MNIETKLNAPFPFVDKTQDNILLSVLFGVFIYTFLIIFQPFGIVNVLFYKSLFVLGYAVITSLILFSSFFLYPKFFSNFNSEKWTIRKMFIFTVFQILLTSILNWVYTITIGKEVMEQHSLTRFIFITFSVGIIPISFAILLLERFLNRKNELKANKLTNDFFVKSENTLVNLGIDQNALSIYLSDLLCIKAEGNYVKIYIIENSLVKKHLVRCSLLKMKQQLEFYTQIKHCHRSFIVNTQHLIKITGNARNFNLHLNHLDFSIPVSRSFPIQTIKN